MSELTLKFVYLGPLKSFTKNKGLVLFVHGDANVQFHTMSIDRNQLQMVIYIFYHGRLCRQLYNRRNTLIRDE